MKNLHIIATDKPTGIFETNSGLQYSIMNKVRVNPHNGYHIYITNSEEIKEGDWFIRDGSFHKCFRVHKTDIEFLTSIDSVYCGSNTFWSKEFCKKIILTTDQDLIKDGVQVIDDDFLEWFVKNPSCEEVEVKLIKDSEDHPELEGGYREEWEYYGIIIPKEPKQETLEEVAERILDNNIDGLRDALQDDDLFYFYKGVIQSYGEAMAQYQTKRMYSEIEVLQLLLRLKQTESYNSLYEWFKQFKKK